MTQYVAFLRAINVGGHVVKMDRLRQLFESAGLAGVSTFIASGNVLFESKKAPGPLESLIEKTLKSELGYEVVTMLRSAADLAAVVKRVDREGFTDVAGVRLYVGFLKDTPTAEAQRKVAAMSNDIDTLVVLGRELYWRCNTSFSDSTITGPALARALGTPVTTRNVTTVRKLAAKCVGP